MRRCDEAVDVMEEYEFRVIGKGSVRDQAELHEHIARFESLGLKLRELRRVSLPSSTTRA
jgi:hypothetical protein